MATEALRALLTLASHHGAGLARADTALANLASQRVMERAGMREVRRDGEAIY